MELRYCEKCHGIIVLEGEHEQLKPLENFVCSSCRAGGEDSGDAPAKEISTALKTLFDEGDLNLFSPDTVVIRKNEMLLAAGGPDDGSSEDAGASSPARTAKRIQFHCLHCKAMLRTKPVETPSRLVCPRCKGILFIDRRGVVSKSPPAGAADPAVASSSSILQAGFRKTSRPEAKLTPQSNRDLEHA